MASVNYDNVYSRFFMKVEAFDFLYEEIPKEVAEEIMATWLHSAIAYPYIRKVFGKISVDDESKTFTYTLRYEIDDFTDAEFVTELLAYGLMHSWLQPKVNSITNIIQNSTSPDSKFYSQAKHLSELRALLEDTECKIRGLIRDRGYLNNTYLDGDKS